MQNLMLKQRRKVPPVILLMLLFLFAVYFLLNNFVSERGYFFIIQNTSFMPLRFSEGEAWWSLLTYSFLHNGWEHLLMNSLWFLAIGIPVSLRIGWFRFVFFYLFCCICAALFYWLFNSDASVLMIGASGGVAGIMGAAVRFIFKQPGDNLFRLHPPRARVMYIHECLKTPRVLMFIVIWIMVNIIFGTMGMVVQLRGILVGSLLGS